LPAVMVALVVMCSVRPPAPPALRTILGPATASGTAG
jgi:hypothetical protein